MPAHDDIQIRDYSNGKYHRRDGEGPAREDRRGHDGLQGCAHRDERRHGGCAVDWLRKKGLSKAAKKAGRVAAEGLIGIFVSGKKGAMVEVEFRDRLRGAQRSLPGSGEDDRRCRAQHRRGRRGDQGRQGRFDDGRGRNFVGDRYDRREHDAAPRRRALGRAGRDRELCAQPGLRRPRQDRRAGRARILRQCR